MSRPVPSVSLSRRDLRFFNAFPRLRINRYEGVIRATNLRDRAASCFGASRDGLLTAPLLAYFPSVSRPLPCRFQDCGPFPFDNAAFNNAVSGLHQLLLGRIMGADNVHAIKGSECTIRIDNVYAHLHHARVFNDTGLAFFYGGLSRRKNVINTMLMCFSAIGLVGVLWIVAGWSLAYGGDGSSRLLEALTSYCAFRCSTRCCRRPRATSLTAPSTPDHQHRLSDGICHDHCCYRHGQPGRPR